MIIGPSLLGGFFYGLTSLPKEQTRRSVRTLTGVSAAMVRSSDVARLSLGSKTTVYPGLAGQGRSLVPHCSLSSSARPRFPDSHFDTTPVLRSFPPVTRCAARVRLIGPLAHQSHSLRAVRNGGSHRVDPRLRRHTGGGPTTLGGPTSARRRTSQLNECLPRRTHPPV